MSRRTYQLHALRAETTGFMARDWWVGVMRPLERLGLWTERVVAGWQGEWKLEDVEGVVLRI